MPRSRRLVREGVGGSSSVARALLSTSTRRAGVVDVLGDEAGIDSGGIRLGLTEARRDLARARGKLESPEGSSPSERAEGGPVVGPAPDVREAAAAIADDAVGAAAGGTAASHAEAIFLGVDVGAGVGHRRARMWRDAVRERVLMVPRTGRALLAGGLSGALSKTATAPVELVRVNITVGKRGAGTGAGAESVAQAAVRIVRETVRDKGVKGLWRGNGADVLRVMPSKAIQLTAFEALKRRLSVKDSRTGELVCPPWRLTVAGGLAGVVSTVCTFPLETVRTRLAADPSYVGAADVVTRMLRDEPGGALALFRGLGPSVAGIIPYAGLNLAAYETIKAAYLSAHRVDKQPVAVSMLNGSLSGLFASTATFPLEVVRRRMMMGTAQGSTISAMRTIAVSEGISALYKGAGVSALKLLPAAGISFAAYEYFKDVLLLSTPLPPPSPPAGAG